MPKSTASKSTKKRKKKPELSDIQREWMWEQALVILEPQPLMTVSEFVEGRLILPNSASEPGPYRVSRTPYAKEPMDACSPSSKYRKIVLYTGTQLMKTQLELNVVYFYIINSPTSILFVFPNDREGKLMVKTRVNPMIDDNEDLKKRIGSTRSNSKGDTAVFKEFTGGFLKLASGESSSSLKSTPCQVVIIDELDEMPDNVKGQGTVISLATERTNTFAGREKIIISSTTTNENSKIDAEYKTTDQRHCFVPCPHCHELIEFEWHNFHWKAEGSSVKQVWYECPVCHKRIDEHHKRAMLNKNKWIPTATEPTDPTSVGFWLPGLYSPWKSWHNIVGDFLLARADADHGKHARMTAFYNNVLAKPYTIASERPDWNLLFNLSRGSGYSRCSSSDDLIPNDVLVLTSGADIQENRIEVEIRGWGRNGRSWSIDYRIFLCSPGETTKDVNSHVWEQYNREILQGIFTREDGTRLQISANAMDRGHNTAQVNAFWGRVSNDRFHLVRGYDVLRSPISSVKEDKGGQDRSGKTKQYRGSAYKYFDVGTNMLKSEIYSNLTLLEQTNDRGEVIRDTPFVMRFPNDYDDEFFKQMTAEEWRPPENRRRFGRWETIRDRNEALDCAVYNLAMWYKLEMYRFTSREYDALEESLAKQPKTQKSRPSAAKQRSSRLLSKGVVL